MSKLVVLSLGTGDLHSGFASVTAELWEQNDPNLMQLIGKFTGSLPPDPEILVLYRDWQFLYEALYQRFNCPLRIEIETSGKTNISELDFSDLCSQLETRINAWLNSEPFQNIDQQLRTELSRFEEIRFLIETKDPLLRRIPWHLWNFFVHYPNAELGLSSPDYQPPPSRPTKINVKILAILGNRTGINLEQDRACLEKLSHQAEIKFLVEPQSTALNDQLWAEGWDILFFAGHSSSEANGQIQLNSTEKLTIDQLKHALKKAISRGLKLAIFNSCDGLELAQKLSDLHLPQVIVMREPVPDKVAQEFLKHFLTAFAGGQSLYAAVREARERLQKLESEFPCATWLPVVCQNPTVIPMTWPVQGRFSIPRPRSNLSTILLVSLIITFLVIGLRYLGTFQTWELQAYDQLMQWRSTEKPDPRLLIVTIDDADIQYQNRLGMEMRWSLSDQALSQLLEKLEPYRPRTIGIDIYRDFPVDPKQPDLAIQLRENDRLFAVCKVSAAEDGAPEGNPPPPEVPKGRLGFSDFVADDSEIIRRHLLALTPPPTSPCAAKNAFGLVLALHYLDAQSISSTITPNQELQVGDVVFKRLQSHTSGYQGVDAAGYQVLLNYRSLQSPQNIAQQVALRDVLEDRINPELSESLQDRLILIGVSATTTADTWKTPYSAKAHPHHRQIPGVFVQAQMISHILSAVLDHRPQLWWWPMWGEVIWVWGWSLVGGMIAGYVRYPLRFGLAEVAALLALFGICCGIFSHAGWVPLVPSALALVATQVALISGFRLRAHVGNTKRYLGKSYE